MPKDALERNLQELKKEKSCKALIQGVQAAVVVHGLNTEITQCNQIAQNLLGLTENQMIGKESIDPVWNFLREDGSIMPPEEYPVIQALNNKKPLKNFIAGIRKPDMPEPTWVVVSAVPEMDDKGNISQIIVTFMDITDRKAIEQKLRESELKHKTLVKNIPGMVYRAYSDWSAEVICGSRRICGYTNEELNSKEDNWLSIIHPDDKEDVFKKGMELIKSQKDNVQIYRIITRDGDIRWVEDRKTSLFSKNGKFKGIDGIVFDITDRKNAEEALIKEKEKLQEAILKIKQLRGLLPICASCKRIRDDKGYWRQIESYIEQHSEAEFSHSICPECANKIYPELGKKYE